MNPEPLPSAETPEPIEKQIEDTEKKHPVASGVGRLLLSAVFAALTLFLFVKLADEVMESETQQFDSAVIQFFQQHSTSMLHSLMAALSWLASGNIQSVLVTLVAAVFLWKRRFWPDGVAMLLAGFGGMIVDSLLKDLIHRRRPEPIFYSLGYSFPSGHAFSAIAIYGLLAYFLAKDAPRKRRIGIWSAAAILILLVGFSRVALMQHYPTDVLGGYAAGLCWLWGCMALPILWERRLQKQTKEIL